MSIPPTCLVTVLGDNSVPEYVQTLNYSAILKGALIGDFDEESMICIIRTMCKEGARTIVHVHVDVECSGHIDIGSVQCIFRNYVHATNSIAVVRRLYPTLKAQLFEMNQTLTLVNRALKILTCHMCFYSIISSGHKLLRIFPIFFMY